MPSIELAALRLVKVPDAAPPYDCDTHGADCPALSGPALSGLALSGLALHDSAPSGTAWGAPAGARPAGTVSVPRRPGTQGAPAGTGAGAATVGPRQLSQVMTEVLAGLRPVRQVVPWATDRVVAQLRGIIPGFASDRRPTIKRLITSRPAAGAVEVAVVADFGPRMRAVAMRFEHVPARPAAPGIPHRPARWLCTALEAG